MSNKDLKKRIKAGIKFFRKFIEPNKYDYQVFKKYWPDFLDLVEKYLKEK